MKKFYFFILIILLNNGVQASEKDKIIENLKNIRNIIFNFEQNINDKIENGVCTIQYPKKIFCKYNSANQKILVSDGKLLAIKTLSSYYLYSLKQTPLEFILDKEFLIKIHKTINKVNSDIDRLQFNTAVASMMELLNMAYKYRDLKDFDKDLFGFFIYNFIVLSNPFIPHLSNELWSRTEFNKYCLDEIWVKENTEIISKDKIKVAVQIKGKTRGLVEFLDNNLSEHEIESLIMEDPKIAKHFENKEIVKRIYIKNKIMNFIIK